MNVRNAATALVVLLATALLFWPDSGDQEEAVPAGRKEVIFWHFWGGDDRRVVQDIVARFNRSQNEHFVRAIAMPGNNLDLKLFLAVTGGRPPDVINQDDPIVADWAARGALMPLEEIATQQECERLREWLFPAAVDLCEHQGRLYGLCNGLDIRALYYNNTMLKKYGLTPPRSIADLDRIAEKIPANDLPANARPGGGNGGKRIRFGYLPDARRLWAWAIVFGGRWTDDHGNVVLDDEANIRALQWMTSYSRKYGPRTVTAFRQGDQSLPGKSFPLLAGRYAIVMDGQWRTRDIAAAQKRQQAQGQPVTEYGVCPLPPPPGGRALAGWVNGNFFLLPRGAANSQGAWEFMKFWSGFDGHEADAAQTCAEGGWIPVSKAVVDQPRFQAFLREQPLFREFVALAAEPFQKPTPIVPGAPFLYREVVSTAESAMYEDDPPAARVLLQRASENVARHLKRFNRRAATP